MAGAAAATVIDVALAAVYSSSGGNRSEALIGMTHGHWLSLVQLYAGCGGARAA
jgi:hypothetical protein